MAAEELEPLEKRSAIQRARQKAWPEGVAGRRGRKMCPEESQEVRVEYPSQG